jgi:phosphatidylinositol alpha-1,6-mannosyltransferase
MIVDWFRKEQRGKKQILFFALETYSLIGGLQSFNRRLIKHLGLYTISNKYNAAYVGVLRDRRARIPSIPGVKIEPFGHSRIVFLFKAVLKSIFIGDILLLGSINITSIAFFTKIFNKKIKIILFVHGDDVWNDPRYRKKKIYDKLFLKSVDCIASVSWYTAHTMAREFAVPLSTFRLMPNATDWIAAPLDRTPEGKRILAVSRLDSHDTGKNVDKLIQAMVYVSKNETDAVLEIVGDGVLRPELEQLAARIGVERCVRFLGRLQDEQLREAYARATVFALPSSKEGFGIVYLEAWQFGLPVICSKFGAPSEIVSDGDDGFVVDPDDVKALAAKIIQLLGDKDLAKRFGENGRKKADKKYSDAQYGENLKAILSEIEDS